MEVLDNVKLVESAWTLLENRECGGMGDTGDGLALSRSM